MLGKLQCFQGSVVRGRASVCDAVMGDVCERGGTSVNNAITVDKHERGRASVHDVVMSGEHKRGVASICNAVIVIYMRGLLCMTLSWKMNRRGVEDKVGVPIFFHHCRKQGFSR